MKSLTKWILIAVAAALTAGGAAAADTIAAGTVKSIDSDKKTFVLTDTANKEHMFKIGDKFVVNRAGDVSKGGLKAGDAVNVCYEDSDTPWVSHYVLVQEGDSKGSMLIRGKVKGYDAEKKELTFTSDAKENGTYALGEAKVSFKGEDAKIGNVKIGDAAMLIVQTTDGKLTVKCIMVDRAQSEK